MQLNEITDTIRVFVRNHYRIPDSDADFNDEVHLFDYGYVDSFGAVEMMEYLESTYGVTISDEDQIMHSLNTINEISVFIHMRLAEKD